MNRLPTLDGWRGVAILAVVGCHVGWLAPNGAIGVHLFFALSGFLITTRLIEEHARSGRIDWTNFYIRRAFRILPPAMLYLLAIATLGLLFHKIPVDKWQLLASAAFFRNYVIEPVARSWYTGHFWSLAVEEHFYLLWPLALSIAGLRRALVVTPFLSLTVILWRTLDTRHQWITGLDPRLRDAVGRTDYRLDGLLWGCLAALSWARPKFQTSIRRVAGSALAIAIVVLIGVCLYWKPPLYLAILPLLMALLPLATLAKPAAFLSRALDWPALVWTGRISYSLYLWQQLFLPPAEVPTSLGCMQSLPLNLVSAVMIAACSYYMIERHSIALGKYLSRV